MPIRNRIEFLNFISIQCIEYSQTKWHNDNDVVNHNFQTILYHPGNNFHKIILNANSTRKLLNIPTKLWTYVMNILSLCGNEYKYTRSDSTVGQKSNFHQLLHCLFSVSEQRFSSGYFMYNDRDTDNANFIDEHLDSNQASCSSDDVESAIDSDILLAMKDLKKNEKM